MAAPQGSGGEDARSNFQRLLDIRPSPHRELLSVRLAHLAHSGDRLAAPEQLAAARAEAAAARREAASERERADALQRALDQLRTQQVGGQAAPAEATAATTGAPPGLVLDEVRSRLRQWTEIGDSAADDVATLGAHAAALRREQAESQRLRSELQEARAGVQRLCAEVNRTGMDAAEDESVPPPGSPEERRARLRTFACEFASEFAEGGAEVHLLNVHRNALVAAMHSIDGASGAGKDEPALRGDLRESEHRQAPESREEKLARLRMLPHAIASAKASVRRLNLHREDLLRALAPFEISGLAQGEDQDQMQQGGFPAAPAAAATQQQQMGSGLTPAADSQGVPELGQSAGIGQPDASAR